MSEKKQSVFQLEKFVIPQITIQELDSVYTLIELDLDPSGVYNTLEGQFSLVLKFNVIAVNPNEQTDKKDFITGLIKAVYEFDGETKYSEIPSYFFQSCIAIIFPYFRAFISTITLQAGLRVLVLPILNLTSYGDVLKQNTEVLE